MGAFDISAAGAARILDRRLVHLSAMSFIPPMLCSRLENPAGLAVAATSRSQARRAARLDQCRRGPHVACYSRPGRDLLRHPGMAWLRTLAWPVRAAVLDGEACAGDGHEGIQAVFEE